ncbi:DUF1648 domain-containing protein [Candidatus Fermentibacteria bacterium]|nr:DUF1648 domain-containing protein [Candidatus Fermentibacteria bacterium]
MNTPTLEQRPLPELDPDPRNTILAVMGLVMIIACSVWLASVWDRFPEEVNTHFGPSGRPDGTGSKYSIIVLPAMALVMWITLGFLIRIPHKFNYAVRITPENAQRQYELGVSMMSWMRLIVPAIMCYIAWAGLKTFIGETDALDPLVLVVIGLSMAAVILSHIVLMLRAK